MLIKDKNKTKEQLIDELVKVRLHVQELSQAEARYKRREEELSFSLQQQRLLINAGPDFDITGRQRAESQKEAALEALRKSEEFQNIILSNVGAYIYLKDTQYRYTYVNSKVCHWFGFQKDEIVGKDDTNFFSAASVSEIMKSERRVIEHGETITGEETYLTLSDKLPRTCRVVKLPLKDKSGNICGLCGISTDITDYKQAEEALKQSESQLSSIIEFLPDATFVIDLEGKVIAWNRAIEQMTGVSKEKMIGQGDHACMIPFYGKPRRHLMDFIEVSDQDLAAKHPYIQRRGNTLYGGAFTPIVNSGKSVYLFATAAPLFDNRGNRVGAIESIRDITDYMRAEEQLRETHRRLDEIIEYLPDATFVINAEGKVIAWNKAIEQMTGIPASYMLGKGDYEYALPFYGERRPLLIDLVLKPREDIEAKYVRTKRKGILLDGEAYMPALRGGEVYLSGRASALQDSKGNIVGAIESIRDITDRKRAEEKYRAIFENAVEGIFQTTTEGQMISANPAMAGLLGYDSPADFIQSVPDIVRLCAKPDAWFSFKRAIEEKGTVNQYEIPCVRKDGKPVLIAVNAKMIKDEKGIVRHYEGFFENITEQKIIENNLRESEERLRSIVETSTAGIIVTSIDGQILFANRQIAGMLGYRVDDLMGTHYLDYVHPENRENVLENMDQMKNSDLNQLQVQRRYVCRNGSERWGYVSIGRINIEHGVDQVVLVISDMTEFKKVEQEKKEMESHLRQAQKMEAIGTLAGGIAHDFNNILASIMGFTEMAVKETSQDIRCDYLDQVLQASERAKNLVNQILTFSRQREQERKPVEIRLIIKEALALLRATLPTTIDMKQEITGEPATVMADPTHIHQIVMNLCTNAAQALAPKGGLLEVHLSNISIGAAGLSLHPDLMPGPYALLSVRDTGCGIDPAIRDRIFDPFFTTKKNKEGTGLGLSVVYSIVKSCGGWIDVQSNAGQGTTFMIYLPCIPLEKEVEEIKQKDIDLQGNERILFVDDETMLVKMTKAFFENLGYRITATTSSPEALRLFQENPEDFDLVITDMTMPQITGAELSREFLKVRPGLPIILCTGHSDSISMEEAGKLNIREFILKPLLLKDLGSRVRRILDN